MIMFINENHFASLAKTAYKNSGITFGNIEIGSDGYNGGTEGIFISSGYWGIWFDKLYMSNKLKDLLIELAGILPTEGKCYKVSKSEPTPQAYLDEMDTKIFDNVRISNKAFTVTPVLFKGNRLLKSKENKRIVAINDYYYKIIDLSKIDYEIEGEPEAAVTSNITDEVLTHPFYWRNEICIYFIMPLKFENDVTRALQDVDFNLIENRLDDLA